VASVKLDLREMICVAGKLIDYHSSGKASRFSSQHP
jgi:hypothetical protein